MVRILADVERHPGTADLPVVRRRQSRSANIRGPRLVAAAVAAAASASAAGASAAAASASASASAAAGASAAGAAAAGPGPKRFASAGA